MPTQRCECGAMYRFPESAVGKRAKCKRCGTVLTLTGDDELSPIPIAEDDVMDETPAADGSNITKAASEALQPISTAYLPTAESRSRLGPVVIEPTPTVKSYPRSVLAAFLFLASLQNLLTFLFLWVAIFIVRPLPYVGWLVAGWYAAFRFNVVAAAAAGDDELPTMDIPTDFLDEIVFPIFRWVGSWVFVLLPAFAYSTLAIARGWLSPSAVADALAGGLSGLLQPESRATAVLLMLVCVGVLLWPIILLCVALGGFSTVRRLDLIFQTVFRTLPAYLVTVAMVFGIDGLKHIVARTDTGIGAMASGVLILSFLGTGLAIYFEIVAMQVIGLYYHHFKHRFAWSWG